MAESNNLPCPFCGSSALTRGDDGTSTRRARKRFFICSSCGAAGPKGKTEKAALAAWNQRASEVGEARD